ncbi:hypothetical protein GCM10027586_01930 [Kineococcus gypseus]|uniref:hypothetical protein n=1 Tax=Kineococcus gypseus TaxID=1637102 RepID=UPI003D7E4E84
MGTTHEERNGEVEVELGERAHEPVSSFAEEPGELRHRRQHQHLREQLLAQAADDVHEQVDLDRDERGIGQAAALSLQRAGGHLACPACAAARAASARLADRARVRRRAAEVRAGRAELTRLLCAYRQEQRIEDRFELRGVVTSLLVAGWCLAREHAWSLPAGWLVLTATLLRAVGLYRACEPWLLNACQRRFPWHEPSPQVLRRWLRWQHRWGSHRELRWPGDEHWPTSRSEPRDTARVILRE